MYNDEWVLEKKDDCFQIFTKYEAQSTFFTTSRQLIAIVYNNNDAEEIVIAHNNKCNLKNNCENDLNIFSHLTI